MVRTANNHDEFLEIRSWSIGSSEIPTILGVNPYQTPYALWLRKTGRAKPFEGNMFTRAGHKLEPVVAEYFEEETGKKVLKDSADVTVHFFDRYKFISASPDREYMDGAGRCILECKTTQSSVDTDEFPLYWFSQLQWQLGVLGLEKGAVAWLERGLVFGYEEFDFVPDFFEECVELAAKWWKDHVEADVAPPHQNVSDTLEAYPRHEDGKMINATEELAQTIDKLSGVKAEIKALSQIKEGLEEQIKMAIGDAEAVVHYGQILCTWKAARPSKRLDTKALREDMPEVYEQFCRKTPGSRRFLLKV